MGCLSQMYLIFMGKVSLNPSSDRYPHPPGGGSLRGYKTVRGLGGGLQREGKGENSRTGGGMGLCGPNR